MQLPKLENNTRIDFNSPEFKRYRLIRLFKNRLLKLTVTTGGLSVVAAVMIIFFYLLYEVAPAFNQARMKSISHHDQQPTSLYLAVDEQTNTRIQASSTGKLTFYSLEENTTVYNTRLALPKNSHVTVVQPSSPDNQLIAAGLSNGQMVLFTVDYKALQKSGEHSDKPILSYPFGTSPLPLLPENESITTLAINKNTDSLLIAAGGPSSIILASLKEPFSQHGHQETLKQKVIELPKDNSSVRYLFISPDQRWVYAISDKGILNLVDSVELESPTLYLRKSLIQNDASITAATMLSGNISIVTGDEKGLLTQWLLTQSENTELKKIRQYKLDNRPITHIVPEQHRKSFIAINDIGLLGIYYPTNTTQLLQQQLPRPVKAVAISSTGHLLVTQSLNQTTLYSLNNKHPEISWDALWHKVFYESYHQPEYIWQSSGAGNSYEPKLSLTPLTFGTLKAAFYAMLLAAPLGICAAIYTAYFMAPALRRKIKPAIELMEALPTVILGFIAGLWLAPLLDSHLITFVVLLFVIPVGVLLFAYLWDHLPNTIKHLTPDGWQLLLLLPIIVLLTYISYLLAQPVETLLFDGSTQAWLTKSGINYSQRNALVVGIAMGFAIIPTVYSIAEDAIHSVPQHLTDGSLALGATLWQTLTRVVLLTASPGIFSAVVIGIGRAVGETMIVLMATGNTPIMDVNIFEGMRTLAATIAIEMPEAEVGSSHYRVLFLAALVLFVFTFCLNTLAELIRLKLRKKYSSL